MNMRLRVEFGVWGLRLQGSGLEGSGLLVHGWDRIKFKLLFLIGHKNVKCYPTMTKIKGLGFKASEAKHEDGNRRLERTMESWKTGLG